MVQHHLMIFALFKVSWLLLSERPAWHAACWRMTKSGSSVWRKQSPWQQVISFVISLSPFFMTVLHQILSSFGTHPSLTFVIICNINSCITTFISIQQMRMSRIMAFASSISFSWSLENPLKRIGYTCLRSLKIGKPTLKII